MKNVITMVGISIFKNAYKKKGYNPHYNKLINKHFSEWSTYFRAIDTVQREVEDWAIGKDQASAEIKSLIEIQHRYNTKLNVILLASDSILSTLAAKIIVNWFKESNYSANQTIVPNFDIDKDVIYGLVVDSAKDFKEKGLLFLFDKLDNYKKDYKKSLIFNITGGFKAVVPFLTLFGQLYKIPTFYIYEDEKELIDLPNLPIHYDVSIVEDNYIAFSYAAKEPQNRLTEDEFINYLDNNPQKARDQFKILMNNQVFRIGKYGKVTLTVYGKLLKRYYEDEYKIGNIFGSLIELRLFEYFIKKKYPGLEIYHSKKYDDFEADLMVVDNNEEEVIVVECKPGGNIPFDDIKSQKITQLLPRIKSNYKYQNFKIKFHIYCYHHKEILKKLKNEMIECNHLVQQFGAIETKWFWLKTDKTKTLSINENNITEI